MEATVEKMENKPTSKNNQTLNANFLVGQLTIQQLIDLSIDSTNDNYIENETRKELINRGKDNIQTRIIIKKICRNSISGLEVLLQRIATEKNNNKEIIKSFKNKFLSSVSILDKLELEWQKHDLGIKG